MSIKVANIANTCPYTLETLCTKSKNSIFSFQQNGKIYKFNKNSIITNYKYAIANRKPFLNPLTRLPLNTTTLKRLNKLIKNKSTLSTQKLTKNETELLKDLITFFVPNKTKSVKLSTIGNIYLSNISEITNQSNLNKISNNINSIKKKLGNNINFSSFNFTNFI